MQTNVYLTTFTITVPIPLHRVRYHHSHSLMTICPQLSPCCTFRLIYAYVLAFGFFVPCYILVVESLLYTLLDTYDTDLLPYSSYTLTCPFSWFYP